MSAFDPSDIRFSFLSAEARAPILEEGRPALVVQDGSFEIYGLETDHKLRLDLIKAQRRIEAVLPSTGRVEIVSETGEVTNIGTGWVIRPGFIVTNQHVLDDLTIRHSDPLQFQLTSSNGIAQLPYINFTAAKDNPVQQRFQITGIHHAVPDRKPDIAFLELGQSAQFQLPPPIPLSDEDIQRNGSVAVIGYPGKMPGRGRAYNIAYKILGDDRYIKRLMPGRADKCCTRQFMYDCFTLGGCSGGVVVALSSGEAVGIHYSGRPFAANFAFNTVALNEELKASGLF